MLDERITETVPLDELAARSAGQVSLCRAFRDEVGPPHAHVNVRSLR
jgi:hypothetical protein